MSYSSKTFFNMNLYVNLYSFYFERRISLNEIRRRYFIANIFPRKVTITHGLSYIS